MYNYTVIAHIGVFDADMKLWILAVLYTLPNTPFTLATENGSGTVRHGIRGSVNTIGLRGTVLARHGLKRRAGTVPRSTGSQCKLKRYRAEGWACV